MAQNDASQRRMELIAKVFFQLGAQFKPDEREGLSFHVEKFTDEEFVASCKSGGRELKLAAENNHLKWADGEQRGAGEFMVDRVFDLIVKFVRKAATK
jgi:hypothetical protein